MLSSSRLNCVRSTRLLGDSLTSPAIRNTRACLPGWRCGRRRCSCGAPRLVVQHDAQVATDALHCALRSWHRRSRVGASPRALCCRQHKSPRESRRYCSSSRRGCNRSSCRWLSPLPPVPLPVWQVVQVHSRQAPVNPRAKVGAVVTGAGLAKPRRSARRGGTSLRRALGPLCRVCSRGF